MSYRFMRVIVFFDLPTLTLENKREYRRFRKFLINSGFIMMQESVYAKLVLNGTVANNIKDKVKKEKLAEGLVQMLVVTERQFSKMEYVVGMKKSNVIDDDKRLIEL